MSDADLITHGHRQRLFELLTRVANGVPGMGFKTAMKVLDRGLAQRILDESRRCARDRKQSGKAIGEFQLIIGRALPRQD